MSTVQASPTTSVSRWLYEQMRLQPALETIGIYVGYATNNQPKPRKDIPGPYITIRHLSSVDRYYIGGRIAGQTMTWEISAWGLGNNTITLRPIDQAIFAALQGKRGPAVDLYISACLRVAPVEVQHTAEDPPFTQLGGEYRVRTSAP